MRVCIIVGDATQFPHFVLRFRVVGAASDCSSTAGRAPGRPAPQRQIAEHKKNLEDAAAMAKLAEEVSEDLEKNDRYVVSIKTLKQLDEIEKLAKAVRGRLKKY
jgi:hypothetical protein